MVRGCVWAGRWSVARASWGFWKGFSASSHVDGRKSVASRPASPSMAIIHREPDPIRCELIHDL